MATYAEQLESVQAAIGAIEGGAQSYSVSTSLGSRAYTKADLQTLYDRERFLRAAVAREQIGGARIRYGTPR